ncbi:Ribonucleoside-diphosphate reductase NrdZ [compost metagenome]
MLAGLQTYVDASISKTIPIPHDYRPERAQALLILAWQMGLKGVTLFRPDKHLAAVMDSAPPTPDSQYPARECGNCG